MFEAIISGIGSLILVLLILYLAYFVSKNIGRVPMINNSSSNMQVLDRIAIGQDRALLIVKVAENYFLMASSQNSISILKELNETDLIIKQAEPLNFEKLDFKEILDKFKKGDTNKWPTL